MTKTIRALDRALNIIQALSQRESCTLAELHILTKLPKPTLHRIVKELVTRGFVRKSVIDQRYRASIFLPNQSVKKISPELVLLADKAMPHIIELTQNIGWPTDLLLLNANYMTLVDTTRPISPFHVQQYMGSANMNLFGSATGLACLSRMPEHRLKKLFDDTKPEITWRADRYGLSWSHLLETLDEVRKRGYAKRLPWFSGVTAPLNDEMYSLAVPLLGKNGPIGAINLLWPTAFMSVEAFADKHLNELNAAADRIGQVISSQN